ncbi:MAG: hemerythrin domain-containing protein [Zoogloeaceae bacterium]|jgi:hemerythrin-like metal-binding protein|nr:hemerythrin domain-containing protein [Zoogloeaceae bacterium]
MLDTFKWDQRYETGIPIVDSQHHRLVDMLNNMVDEVTERQQHITPDDIVTLLDALAAYAVEHFADEEKLMRENHDNIPNEELRAAFRQHEEQHKRQHTAFVEQVVLTRAEYLASQHSQATLELLVNFVTSWLSFHILGSDKEMAILIERVQQGRSGGLEHANGEEAPTSILLEAMEQLYDLMAQRNITLVKTRDELAALNANLEQRVRERTAELEQALTEVERTRERLLQSEKMSAIGQLSAGVAHEINNPVGFVSSNLESLKRYTAQLMELIDAYDACAARLPPADRIALDEKRQALDFDFLRDDIGDLLRESADGLERVRKIVRDMKAFSHVDHDEWQEVNLNDILDSTLNVVRHELKYAADLEIDPAPELPNIRCLPAQVSQVLMNLLVNAAHSIGTPPGKIVLRTRATSSGVEFSIRDSGCGMTPEIKKRIFEPFFTTKPVGHGTGLGLSLSYEIIKRHGGDILVESQPGQGSTFHVLLPLDPDQAGGDASAASAR